jgi:hypothetical protein
MAAVIAMAGKVANFADARSGTAARQDSITERPGVGLAKRLLSFHAVFRIFFIATPPNITDV